MKAVVIDRFVERYDEVRVSNVPMPKLRAGEILIRIRAAGVNFVDTLYARGKHQNNRRHVKPPFTLGLEFAGIVAAAPDSSRFKRGDRVFGGYEGSYAEYIAVPSSSSSLRRIPQGWTFADAAGLAATLPVSYGALLPCGRLRAGETVLIHAAAGGLGLAAVQIAKTMGCKVIGTAGSDEKCRVAEGFGADVCINYQTDPEWWKRVLNMTANQGVDLVFDTVGLVSLSLKCLAHRGRILVVGFAGREGNMEDLKANRVLLKQGQILGYRYGESARRYPEEADRIWQEVNKMIDRGFFQPMQFDREYKGLESVPNALADIAARKIWGKAVVHLDPSSGEGRIFDAKL